VPPPREPANPAFDFSGRGSGAAPSGSSVVKDFFDTPVVIGPETTVGALIGGALGGVHPSDNSKEAPAPGTNPSGTGGPTQAEKNAQEAAEKQKKEQADKEKAEREAAEKAQANYEKQKKEKEEAEKKKKSIVEEGDKYTDPDAWHVTTVTFSTAAEVETMLNVLKHPANPNGGDGGQPTLDLSSPPPRHGGLDPTIAYFDGDAPLGGWAGGSEPIRLTGAPIDFGQSHENPQFAPPDPGVGGGIDPHAHRP
jgi:hypothetical protein